MLMEFVDTYTHRRGKKKSPNNLFGFIYYEFVWHSAPIFQLSIEKKYFYMNCRHSFYHMRGNAIYTPNKLWTTIDLGLLVSTLYILSTQTKITFLFDDLEPLFIDNVPTKMTR